MSIVLKITETLINSKESENNLGREFISISFFDLLKRAIELNIGAKTGNIVQKNFSRKDNNLKLLARNKKRKETKIKK